LVHHAHAVVVDLVVPRFKLPFMVFPLLGHVTKYCAGAYNDRMRVKVTGREGGGRK
jgi:hypothetical protein